MALRQLRRKLSTTTASGNLPILHNSTTSSTSEDTVTLQLLSWGRGSSGQLGNGKEDSHELYPSPFSSLVLSRNSFRLNSNRNNDQMEIGIGIASGLFHSGLVIDAKLWIWGKGDGGRLGFGHENTVFRPTLNSNVESVKSVALGGLHSVALDSLGQVFTWGYGGFGALGHSVYTRELSPKKVEGDWEGKITQIATSGTHTAAITEAGQLYTWGRDEGEGRLGLGPGRGPNEVGGLSIPSKVKALPVPAVSVACGGFFTTVITDNGKLWSWGANSNNELGRGNRVGGWKPQPVSNLEGVHVVQIASGGYHSLALTDKGVLYMWGNAKDGQLGVPGVPEVQPFPIQVKFLMDDDSLGSHNVLSVAVGASHAFCLVSR